MGSKNFFPACGRQVPRQLGYPSNLGPVAFRPPIAWSLASLANKIIHRITGYPE